jgi:hypothetical protein
MTTDDVLNGRAKYALHHGDCLAWLDTLPTESIDAVVCDPPYAEIDRDYGRMTEAQWEEFAHALVRKSLRVLKPRGSAVFIIQPNSERVGRMRAWVFRFLAWCADDLVRETGGRVGMVQDAWWFNPAAMPTIHCNRDRGLMRPSMKPCAWIGSEDCYRAQDEVLMRPAESLAALSKADRVLNTSPSGHHINHRRTADTMIERGGATPMNTLPMTPDGGAGDAGHGAGTPYDLAAWWVRYLCPKGGVVADPCGGTMTMGLAAVRQGRRFLGCEQMAQHFAAGVERMSACDLDAVSPLRVAGDDHGPLFGGVR